VHAADCSMYSIATGFSSISTFVLQFVEMQLPYLKSCELSQLLDSEARLQQEDKQPHCKLD
jgi:hypothetical protein